MTRDRDDFERETETAQALGASVRGLEVPPFAQVRARTQRGGISSALFFPAAAVLLIAALVVGTSIGARRAELSQVAASPSRSAPAGGPSTASTVPTNAAQTSSAAPLGFPVCPPGQLPQLDVLQSPPPGDEPGTGSGNAEAAFVKANPTITEYKMYQFGTISPYVEKSPTPEKFGGPVWIVAGARTFIALYIGSPGQNSWFAHPATFVRCMTQEDLHPNGPVGSPLPARPDGTRG